MSRRAALTPTARREAAREVRGLAAQNTEAARKLRGAIVEAAMLLGQQPLVGRRQPELVGERYRIWPMTTFGYILVYDPDSDPVEILRIVHGARDLPQVVKDVGF